MKKMRLISFLFFHPPNPAYPDMKSRSIVNKFLHAVALFQTIYPNYSKLSISSE